MRVAMHNQNLTRIVFGLGNKFAKKIRVAAEAGIIAFIHIFCFGQIKARIGRELGLPSQFHLEQRDAEGPRATIGGRACVTFTAYDYCGFNFDPRVRQAAIDAVAERARPSNASKPGPARRSCCS